MGNLQNKLISQTYDALIQTGTDEPVDGTLRPLQDGSGQTLPVEISTTGVNFTGTVTGIPGSTDTTYTLDKSYVGSVLSFDLNGSDASVTSIALSPGTGIDLVPTAAGARIDSTVTDTTYDLGAVGASGNINMALSGSDGSNDVVTMQAGTNITLTDNGSNTFTINAAGAPSAVASLNTLDGDLTLVAGSGIAISDDGNTNITIDATGGGGGGTVGVSFVPSNPVAHQGPDSNDNVIASVLIPGGTFQNGDILRLDAFQSMDFTAGGWIYSSIWISSDAVNPYGIQNIGQIQTPNGRDGNYFKTLYINGDSTWFRTYTTNADMQQGSFSGDPTFMATIDWTQNLYLNFNTWVDNAGSFIYLHGMKLTKIN